LPSREYAQVVANSLEVDEPFQEKEKGKTPKVARELKAKEDGKLEIIYKAQREHVYVMRTAINSFLTNLQLVLETTKEFGN
jgi:hypothetical protein